MRQGYAGQILKVDLTAGTVEKLDTAEYTDRFLGGKGLAAKLYWDLVPAGTKAFDAENCLICATGPVAGFTGFASNRWLVCGKSAAGEPEFFSYGNLGGGWGNRLKAAGYDAVVVQGKSDRPVYLFVHDGDVEIKDASRLWGKSTFETSDAIKAELSQSVGVMTIGPAAENLVVFATVLADEGASGSGGMGAVMGSKKLKAIAVAGNKRPEAAHPEKLRQLARHPELARGQGPPMIWVIPGRTKEQACHGCGIGCTRQSYTDETGRRFKSLCQPIDIYRRQSGKYHDGWDETVLLAMRLCDACGLDSCVMQAMIEWITRCHKEGLLSEKGTGLPLSKTGSREYIETLTRAIARREGFGDVLARGTVKAAAEVGGRAGEFMTWYVMNRTSEAKDYDPRLILHNALLFATEPRRPVQQVHEPASVLLLWLAWVNSGSYVSPEIVRRVAETFWGGAAAADFTSYDGKALAAKKIQDRTYALESLVFCNFRWPILHHPLTEDHRADPSLPAQILSAVTGVETGGEEMDATGERIFNLQRAVLLRDGWGGRSGDVLLDHLHDEPLPYTRLDRQCLVPGKNGEAASRQGEVVERDEFEKMKTEYYALRGWDAASGLPTRSGLSHLQLDDVAGELGKRGLLGREAK